jgi:hypothetical protein
MRCFYKRVDPSLMLCKVPQSTCLLILQHGAALKDAGWCCAAATLYPLVRCTALNALQWLRAPRKHWSVLTTLSSDQTTVISAISYRMVPTAMHHRWY